MQGPWVWSLVLEGPACHRAHKPERQNYQLRALEPLRATVKPMHPRARPLQ